MDSTMPPASIEALCHVLTITGFLSTVAYMVWRVLRQGSSTVLKSLIPLDGLVASTWITILAGMVLHTVRLEHYGEFAKHKPNMARMFDYAFSLQFKPTILCSDHSATRDIPGCKFSLDSLYNTWLLVRISSFFAMSCAMTFALVNFEVMKPYLWTRKEVVGAVTAFTIGCATLLCVIQAFINFYVPVGTENGTHQSPYVVFTSPWEAGYTAAIMAVCVAGVKYFVGCGDERAMEEGYVPMVSAAENKFVNVYDEEGFVLCEGEKSVDMYTS